MEIEVRERVLDPEVETYVAAGDQPCHTPGSVVDVRRVVRFRVLAFGLALLLAATMAAATVEFVPKAAPAPSSTAAFISSPDPFTTTRSGSDAIAAAYVTGDVVGDENPAQVMRLAVDQAQHGTGSCRPDVYVTGDLVGDDNPAVVYAAMCRWADQLR
jgi:hypothetical protein